MESRAWGNAPFELCSAHGVWVAARFRVGFDAAAAAAIAEERAAIALAERLAAAPLEERLELARRYLRLERGARAREPTG
jgi:hypothetical protein